MTHRSDLSKKTYLPVLDRRTHPFAGSKQFPSGRHTYGTAGGQKSVHVGWESGIFLRCFHMKWSQAFWHIDLAFFFRSRWHFFEWTRRLPSMRMTKQKYVHFGGFNLVWFFAAARCKPAQLGVCIILPLDHELQWFELKSACLSWNYHTSQILLGRIQKTSKLKTTEKLTLVTSHLECFMSSNDSRK